MFHEKFKSMSLFLMHKQLFSAFFFKQMRFRQMRITIYF